jgi:hypothetical protein
LDDAIEAIVDARNHAPPPQIQREILLKLTLRLHAERLFDHEPATESNKPDRPMAGIHQTGSQPAMTRLFYETIQTEPTKDD